MWTGGDFCISVAKTAHVNYWEPFRNLKTHAWGQGNEGLKASKSSIEAQQQTVNVLRTTKIAEFKTSERPRLLVHKCDGRSSTP